MPFVPGRTWTATFSFQDNNNNLAGVSVYYPAAMAYDDVLAAANDLADAMAAASSAWLFALGVSSTLFNNVADPKNAESEVERKLVIPLGTANDKNVTSLEVPSPAHSMEQNDTDIIPATQPLLAQILTELISGPAGTGVSTYYAEDITRAGVVRVRHRTRKQKG